MTLSYRNDNKVVKRLFIEVKFNQLFRVRLALIVPYNDGND